MVKLLRITATEHIFGSAIGLVYRGSGRLIVSIVNVTERHRK
jgi:hypothetical protein